MFLPGIPPRTRVSAHGRFHSRAVHAQHPAWFARHHVPPVHTRTRLLITLWKARGLCGVLEPVHQAEEADRVAHGFTTGKVFFDMLHGRGPVSLRAGRRFPGAWRFLSQDRPDRKPFRSAGGGDHVAQLHRRSAAAFAFIGGDISGGRLGGRPAAPLGKLGAGFFRQDARHIHAHLLDTFHTG